MASDDKIILPHPERLRAQMNKVYILFGWAERDSISIGIGKKKK
jgi:hypothetical protein